MRPAAAGGAASSSTNHEPGRPRFSICRMPTLLRVGVEWRDIGGFKGGGKGGRAPLELASSKFHERLSGGPRIHENLLAAGLCHGPRWGSLQRSPDNLAGEEEAGCPFPKDSAPGLRPIWPRPWPEIGLAASNMKGWIDGYM